jgi:hypothetical protein
MCDVCENVKRAKRHTTTKAPHIVKSLIVPYLVVSLLKVSKAGKLPPVPGPLMRPLGPVPSRTKASRRRWWSFHYKGALPRLGQEQNK